MVHGLLHRVVLAGFGWRVQGGEVYLKSELPAFHINRFLVISCAKSANRMLVHL